MSHPEFLRCPENISCGVQRGGHPLWRYGVSPFFPFFSRRRRRREEKKGVFRGQFARSRRTPNPSRGRPSALPIGERANTAFRVLEKSGMTHIHAWRAEGMHMARNDMIPLAMGSRHAQEID